MNYDRQLLRTMVRGGYDLQQLRIETGNRIVANFRSKVLGEDAGESDDDGKVLDELERRFKLITDSVVEVTRRKKYEYDGVISNFTELALISHYMLLKQREDRQFRDVGYAVAEFSIWQEFLLGVKGCGPMMAGVIISEIDIHRAPYPSSLWKYAGLDVAGDGRGRSRKAEHLIDKEYTAADGEQKMRKSITFNPWLKTKLVGVLGTSFLRSGGQYREVYDNYKHRLETDPRHEEKTKGWRHNMAIRYAVKMFLLDLYKAWRPLEGLPVAPSYHEAKQGHVHKANMG